MMEEEEERSHASSLVPEAIWQLRLLPDFTGAACKGRDDLPWALERGRRLEVAGMKAVCARCPVLASCRKYALENPVDGFWGGMTMIERREWRKEKGLSHGRRWSSHYDEEWALDA